MISRQFTPKLLREEIEILLVFVGCKNQISEVDLLEISPMKRYLKAKNLENILLCLWYAGVYN